MNIFKRKKVKKDDIKLIGLLKKFGIDTVLDVGANVGQYATKIRDSGYTGKIISFEPLSKNNNALMKVSAKDPMWIIHPQCAIGGKNGTVDINISEHNDMSSILEIGDEMVKSLPKSRYIDKETVNIITIDSAIDTITSKQDKIFLKVDTQGFEDAVIQGAQKSLRNATIIGVQLELSLLPLYKGEKTYDTICKKMADYGFETHLIIPGYYSKKLNRQFQADFVFFKT